MTEQETKIADRLLDEISNRSGAAPDCQLAVQNYDTFIHACVMRASMSAPPSAPTRPFVAGTPSRAGAKGRQVIVQNIDEDSPFVGAIEIGAMYPSASEASRTLGCAHNALYLAMKNAEGKNEKTAKVKGVEFQYVDTIEVRD